MTIALNYAARSDIGLVRANNQDSGYAGPHLLVIADGMGGHAGGDVASSVTVAEMSHLDTEDPGAEALAELENTILTANDRIADRVRREPALAGMGTTVTALLRSGQKLAMAHIGDSRAYLRHDGEVHQITRDHTFVQKLVDEGRITPEEAARHPQRSVLMRVLGDVDLIPELDLSVREAHPGDRWMLCSDGLSGLVSVETIDEVMRTVADPGEAADRLVELALRAGGHDNVTVIVADVVETDVDPNPSDAPEVVGAAAESRHAPTRGANTPAGRAAALRRGPDVTWFRAPEADHRPGRGRRIAVRVLWALLAALVLAAAAWGGYRWTQTRFFVTSEGNQVVVYRGISQSLGPIELHERFETVEGLTTDELPAFSRQRLAETIPAGSLTEVRRVVDNLRAQTSP